MPRASFNVGNLGSWSVHARTVGFARRSTALPWYPCDLRRSISVAFYRQTGLAALQPRTTFLRKQLALFRSGPCKFLFDSAGATKSLSCSRPAFGGGTVSATRPLGLCPETGRFAYLDWMNSFV